MGEMRLLFVCFVCTSFGPAWDLLENVLHALQALRPCDPRNGAINGQCIREIQKITDIFLKFYI